MKRPKAHRGQATLEMVLALPAFLALFAIIVTIAPLAHVKFVADQAAYDCAINAAQSLDMARGAIQGRMAALRTLQYSRMAARSWVDVRGDWSRSGMVICTVKVQVPTPAFRLFPIPRVMTAVYTVPAQRNKSEWQP